MKYLVKVAVMVEECRFMVEIDCLCFPQDLWHCNNVKLLPPLFLRDDIIIIFIENNYIIHLAGRGLVR